MWAHCATLIFVSVVLSQTPAYTATHGHGPSVSRGVPVYVNMHATSAKDDIHIKPVNKKVNGKRSLKYKGNVNGLPEKL